MTWIFPALHGIIPPINNNVTPADYQYLRDFVDRLEHQGITDSAQLPRADVDRYWQAFARVWPGHVEVSNRRAEGLLMFFMGVLVSLFVIIAYHHFVSPAPERNSSLPSGTI